MTILIPNHFLWYGMATLRRKTDMIWGRQSTEGQFSKGRVIFLGDGYTLSPALNIIKVSIWYLVHGSLSRNSCKDIWWNPFDKLWGRNDL